LLLSRANPYAHSYKHDYDYRTRPQP
jgi:hypothetical protein